MYWKDGWITNRERGDEGTDNESDLKTRIAPIRDQLDATEISDEISRSMIAPTGDEISRSRIAPIGNQLEAIGISDETNRSIETALAIRIARISEHKTTKWYG